MTDVKHKMLGWVQRFARWLFGAPFEELPPGFGDPAPPELRVFEAEAEEILHHPVGKVSPPPVQHGSTNPARRDESLERE